MSLAVLWCAVTAQAQVALPQVNVPTPPQVTLQQSTPQLPLASPVPQSLPTLQPKPSALGVQVPPTVQMPQMPQASPVQQLLKLPQLPAVQSPTSLPQAPGADVVRVPSAAGADALTQPVALQQLRATTVRTLLRVHADVLEADPNGEPVRRQELLLVSPTPAILAGALAQGFAVLRDFVLPDLDLRQVVLRPPPGLTTTQALALLRALDPQVVADFNHIYTPSGGLAGSGSVSAVKRGNGGGGGGVRRVGLVDGGLDRQHPALRAAMVQPWGCGGASNPTAHGTAVASLLVGGDGAFSGALTGSELYAADIYCGQPASGAADTIAQAVAWMVRERVPVVNISLVGPSNRLLEQVVQAMHRKGYLVVAAVGNDGPAAPPLYPAAYPGVVGVTAVSDQRRVLPEAAQGPQVMFAAPGVALAAADIRGGYTRVRGTSFAAPLVAGLLARNLASPNPAAAAQALARLSASAVDLGAPGRDPVFGLGLVGERLARQAVDPKHP